MVACAKVSNIFNVYRSKINPIHFSETTDFVYSLRNYKAVLLEGAWVGLKTVTVSEMSLAVLHL